MSWSVRGLVAALMVCAAALPLVACTPARSSESAKPTAARADSALVAPDYRAQADLLARALSDYAPPANSAREPRGDIGPGIDRWEHLYAVISDISTAPASVTFDVEEYLVGDAAEKAAAQDGQSVSVNGGDYYRNRYRHKQTLRIDPGAPVILQIGGGGLEGDPGFGEDPQLTPVSFAEFARRFRSHPETYASHPAYLLSRAPYDNGSISSIFQVFFP